ISLGNAQNSSQVQEIGLSTAPRIVKLHLASVVYGVGPAESTGKPGVTYCPGGIRDESTSVRRRPWKLRDSGGIRYTPPAEREADTAASQVSGRPRPGHLGKPGRPCRRVPSAPALSPRRRRFGASARARRHDPQSLPAGLELVVNRPRQP